MRCLSALLVLFVALPAAAAPFDLEAHLLAAPDPARLRAWHERFCQEPHPAGSAADRRMADLLAKAFEEIGVSVTRHDFYPYLPEYVSATVEVIQGATRTSLRLRERAVAGDPYVKDDGPVAWNAYSGTGDVTADVVYANYGTREDFAQLSELGVDCTGKIVVARYGKNYRGYKAKYAQAAGAAGLIMYTDPVDSGYGRGLEYPEGGFANPSAIQRGSIKTLDYAGDPLTPGKPATKDAARLDPATVALPKIPVQPMGWEAARQILGAMRGPSVPKGWQGGLPFRYRLTSGDAKLRVRLQVAQKRSIKHCTNVLGVIPGHSQDRVVVGCHYDAWTFGAGDPHAGTIVLYEMARSFAEAVKRGWKPKRTIVFANWACEEYGIIGSSEWVEAQGEAMRNVIAYINLDMAAMGTNFRSSADPLLQGVIETAAQRVPQPGGEGSVHDAWRVRDKGAPRFGLLGGGSDHVAFYCHACVPSCTLGAGGAKGVSYHSSYDNIAWYHKAVGDDYLGARMVTQVGNLLVARLVEPTLLAYTPMRWVREFRKHLDDIDARAAAAELRRPSIAILPALDDFEKAAGALRARCVRPDARTIDDCNRALRAVRMPFDPGLRPWYRNPFAGPDPHSGYAAWALPTLREAIENGSQERLDAYAASWAAFLRQCARHLGPR